MQFPIAALVCVRCGLAVGAPPPPEVPVPHAAGELPVGTGLDMGDSDDAVNLRVDSPLYTVPVTAPQTFLPDWEEVSADPAAVANRRERVTPSDPMLTRLERLLPREYVDRLTAMRGTATGERRIVTILFSDVKGSTAMAEKLDPEDVMEIMNGAFEVLIPPIAKYEGTLARLMGDAILAFFGAPLSHENDPERAVRAALEIVEGAQVYAQRLQEERGISGFNVRVGINTGLVVVGEVGADMRVEYTAMGDAINLAARMEQNALPGGILISEDTFLQVKGLFDIEGRDPISVKGKAEPVRVYTVKEARSRSFHTVGRGVAGVTAPMVGRDRELRQLLETWNTVCSEGTAAVVTVVGDAGVGKSRLLREFEQRAAEAWGGMRLHGRAAPELQRVPYACLRSLFTFWRQIQDNDPTDVARGKLVDGLVEVFGGDGQLGIEQAQMRAHFIGHLLGFDFSDSPHVQGALDDPKQVHDRALAYLQRFFAALGQRGPVMVLLEDLHWADDSSLRVLSELLHGLEGVPLFTLSLTRSSLFERWGGWGDDICFHLRLDLVPLSRDDSEGLLTRILQHVEEIPPALVTRVSDGAEGNPLYVEELVNVLITEGVIITAEGEPWRVDMARFSELQIPPSLRGILQARVDSLTLSERVVLQRASVVGRTFWDKAIAHISRAAANNGDGTLDRNVDTEAIAAWLVALMRRQLIDRSDAPTFAGMGEYAFYHAMMRDVTYEGILRRSRRVYHGWVAEWLMIQSAGREGEISGLIAEHLELAENHVEAIRYLRQAAEHAAARYANTEVVEYYTRALAMLEAAAMVGEARASLAFRLRLGREAAYDILGDRDNQAADLEAVAALLRDSDDPALKAQLSLRWAAYHEATSDFPASLAAAQEAIGYARDGGDTKGEAEGLICCGIACWRQGDLDGGGRYLDMALDVAQQHDHRGERAWALLNLGVIAYFRGDHDEAQLHWERALEAYRETGDERMQARCLSNLVATSHSLGDAVRARALAAQALVAYRALSDRRGEADALCNVAGVERELGDLASAREHYRRALGIYRAIGEQGGEALTLDNLALTLHEDGEHAEAVTTCEQALEIERAIHDRIGEAATLSHLGLAREGAGNLALAAEAYEAALSLHLELDQEALAMDDRAGLAWIAMHQGDQQLSVAHIQPIVDWIDSNGIEGIENPLRVLWIASQVLGSNGQPDAAERVLAFAREVVAGQVAQIGDAETWRSYMSRVPEDLRLPTPSSATQ